MHQAMADVARTMQREGRSSHSLGVKDMGKCIGCGATVGIGFSVCDSCIRKAQLTGCTSATGSPESAWVEAPSVGASPASSPMEMVYFREVQRLWAWVLLLVALSVPIVAVVTALPQNSGNHPGPRPYVFLGVPGLLAVWFSLGSLVTEVRERELSIHFHWLWPERLISWSQIRSAEAETYFSGGWGVRWRADGMTYNVSGNRSVRIELTGGETVIVGSQRAGELAAAIGERIGSPKRWKPDV